MTRTSPFRRLAGLALAVALALPLAAVAQSAPTAIPRLAPAGPTGLAGILASLWLRLIGAHRDNGSSLDPHG